MKKILFFIITSLIFIGCKKSDFGNIKKGDDTKNMYNYILKLGYKPSEIVDNDSTYIVDGDLIFPKNITPDFTIFDQNPLTKQYSTGQFVGYNRQPNITVRIDPSLNSLSNEIYDAIAIWNNVINCRINFTITNSTNQDILITNNNLGNGICGSSYFPINARPGSIIKINANYIANNSYDQRKRTIAHELGHAIGFRHTNWQSSGEPVSGTASDNSAKFTAFHIFGTPIDTDPYSLMNSGQCGYGATSLSNYDIIAVQFLYPENPPVEGTVPVFRYVHDQTGGTLKQDHFFTTSLNELGGDGGNYWTFEGVGFFAFSTEVPGSVPIYRFYSKTESDHFYTRYYDEANASPTYSFESIAFYAYPTSINNSYPIYRFYNPTIRDHHYTKNNVEVNLSAAGYNYENVAFFVY